MWFLQWYIHWYDRLSFLVTSEEIFVMKMLYIIIGAIATNVFAAPIWPSVTNVFTPISFGFLDTADGPSYNILTNMRCNN